MHSGNDSRLRLIKGVPSTNQFCHYKESHWADLFVSRQQSEKPIVAGYWRHDNLDGDSEPAVAEWDEMKYILTGEATFRDFNAGVDLRAEAGDMLWIPEGSKSTITHSKDLTAVYVEQTYRDTVDNVESSGLPKPALADVLAQLQREYEESNTKSREAQLLACSVLPGGNTRSVVYMNPFPLRMDSGRGCYVSSVDGRDYLDFVAEYTAGVLGHSHIAIQQAILNATATGIHLGANNPYEIELAQQLVARFPSINKIRFCNSGTEANMLALAVAKHYTRRSKVLVFRNGYHGSTLDFHEEDGPLNLPHQFVIGEYDNIQSTKKMLSADLAAIIVEPMQGAGGMIPASRDFLAFLRQAADETGAILIFDEVVTSRLHFGGLQQYLDIYPDMTTLGKWIGGGFSFGAFGGREDIMAKLDPRMSREAGGVSHPGTFNNNVFSMAAGAAACKLLTSEKIQAMNILGEGLRSDLRTLLHARGISSIQVTGFGSLTGLQFQGPDAETLRDMFFFHMLKEGIYVGKRGFLNLSIVHEQRHIDQVVVAATKFVTLYF